MADKRKYYESCTRSLVKAVSGFQEDEENFELCLEFALSNFVHGHYSDVDFFKVKRKLNGFISKFDARSEQQKTKALSSLQDQFLVAVSKESADMKYASYSVLSLILQLSGLGDLYGSMSDVSSNTKERVPKEEFNWAHYLKEDTEILHLSDDDSSWSDSDEQDSLENALNFHYKPSPTTDSGIEVSPDSVTSAFPPPMPFEPLQEECEEVKPSSHFKPYWNPQFRRTRLDASLNNIDSNFTTVWEEHLKKLFPAYTPESNTVLPEKVMLREILWMLHGVKDTFVFKYCKDHFEFIKHIHFTHLTENTLKNLLSPLCQHGNKIVALQNFITMVTIEPSSSSRYCSTVQAFTRGISHILEDYSSVLSSYEKRIIDQDETITIIQLTQRLKPDFDKLTFLYNLYACIMKNLPVTSPAWEQSTFLLDLLWKQLDYCSIWTNDKTLLQSFLAIFLSSCSPFFKILESFILCGQPVDLDTEFFIERHQEVQVLDPLFWKSGLKLRSVPQNFFLIPLLNDVLLASKSMSIINELKSHSSEDQDFLDVQPNYLFYKFVHEFQSLYTSLHPEIVNNIQESDEGVYVSESNSLAPSEYIHDYQLLEEAKNECVDIDKHHTLCQRAINLMNHDSLHSLSTIIEQALFPCIYNVCKNQNLKLIEIFNKDYNLSDHMAVMKKYFLMESGEIMFTFYSEIFGKIFDEASWQDMTYINFALQVAVASHDSKAADRLTIDVNEHIQFNINQPLQQLEMLNLNYQVDWPINIILNEECLQKYNQIFCFLMQVKCAKHNLDELYFIPLEVKASGKLSHLNQLYKIKQKLLYGMHILRMKLLHFVNGFHNYLMTRILHSSGLELDENLSKAESLEEVLIIHDQYLSTVQERCLLNTKLPHLRDQILRVMGLTLNFQHIWRSGVNVASTEELKSIENEFSSSVNFLMSYLNKPLKRGRNLHLEALACAILSDSHLQHIFT